MNDDKNMSSYGENVPTNFAWITPEQQKKKARELEEKELSDEDSAT